MRVLENREWKAEVACVACTSLLEIRFADLISANGETWWTCCVCDTDNSFHRAQLPASYRLLRFRAPQSDEGLSRLTERVYGDGNHDWHSMYPR